MTFRQIQRAAAFLVASVLLVGCEGDTGPAGPAGEQGPQGLPGSAGMSGVEFATPADAIGITGVATDLGSITLTCPSDGYVHLMATANLITFGDGTRVQFGLGSTAGAFDLHATRAGVIDGAGTQRRSFSLFSMAVVPVTAGDNTFYVTGQKPSPFDAQQASLIDIYVAGTFFESRL